MKTFDRSLRAACSAIAVAVVVVAAADAKEAPISAAGDKGGVPVVVQGTVHQALFGVAFDGDHGVAVGAMGELLDSTDGGRKWTALDKAPTPLSLLGVGVRGDKRIAVGQEGLILLSDAGGPWTRVDSGTDQRMLSVAMNAQGLAVAVGAFGTVTVSSDGGKTWVKSAIDWTRFMTEPVEPHLYDVIVGDTGVVTVVGEYGLILRSPDAGKNWVAVNHGEASLFDIELRADGGGYAVGQDGYVLATSDGGNVWKPLTTHSKSLLLGVWSSADGHVLIAGMREMLESRDGGQSWKARTDGDFATAWYSGVASPASGGLVLVGHSGRIVRIEG
ncbi:WD40/YVTN/BNR-like repeat-containing protein [Hydrocarboniphaga sp.]|uniref:WD40/YVTN/BNR-like repeat-containing protein n=1 Tax=Hydrocarboniphaga sp. TaxID=2033016 RepID=UPI003D0F4A0C